MKAKESYDVVIVGSGIGGCGAAALLAKDHGKSVLVLEKSPFIGGRVASYTGKGDKVVIDGQELDHRGFVKSLTDTRCWVSHCEPDLKTMFQKGLLDGYTFENGGHGLFWGNKSRCRLLLDHLNKPVDMPVNEGLAFVDARNFDMYQVPPRAAYPWQSEEGFKKTLAALKQMGSLSMEECAAAMEIDVQTWLENKGLTSNEEAYDYIKVVMACQNAMAEPKMAPAGDFLGYMAMARDIKMNLHSGSVATIAEPGCLAIPLAMEQALNEAGGEVRRNTPVEEIVVENGKAVGVIIKTAGGELEFIAADKVICNIPPKHIFNVIHPRHFPSEWVDLLQTKFWSPGLLSAFIGIKNNVWDEFEINEKSFVWMPGIIKDEGYIGAVDMVMWNMAACAKRAPEGKRDYIFSTALTDKEMRNPRKVKRVINYCMDWFKRTFKGFEENVEFVLWTPSDEAYGNWRPVGEKRPDIRSPHVDSLFFVGDQYGERMWGGGVDGASLCAVMVVDEIMGGELEFELYPKYHQGIPKTDTSWEL
ncbi:MAG: NAD(P)/FAD-dependent oxidoreductase [Desulfobacteraceae bacterium]|nr:NAD(P)/FAD-dependent oxidoreductase [Desulfobacteraceae bacterium]